MCKSVVLDLYQKVSRLIRKEMNRKRATDRNLSPIYSLRLPFILDPNITSIHNVTSQYYQGLKGCESRKYITRQAQIQILKLNYSKTTNIYTMGLCVLYYVEYSLYNVKQEGHDGPVLLHWLIREIHSYQTLHYLGIGLKHKTPYKD